MVSGLRATLYLAGGFGFLAVVTSIERLAEHGKLHGPQVGVGFLFATVCAVGSFLVEAFVHRGQPWLRRELLRHLGCAGFALGTGLFLVGSAWAFVTLQKETGAWAVDLGAFRAPVLAAIVSTVVALIGALIAGAAIERRIRDPEKIPQVTRVRILALRAEGKTLAQIGEALAAERYPAAPGGMWTGRLLRAVIRSAPQRPPAGGPRREEMEPPSVPS